VSWAKLEQIERPFLASKLQMPPAVTATNRLTAGRVEFGVDRIAAVEAVFLSVPLWPWRKQSPPARRHQQSNPLLQLNTRWLGSVEAAVRQRQPQTH